MDLQLKRFRNLRGLSQDEMAERVVLEVGLHVLVGVVADDLDGVLVRAHGAVAAEAPELVHSTVPAAAVLGLAGSSGSDRLVTSSTMPTVNSRAGASFSSSLYTANTEEGGVSFEARP